MPVVDIKLKDTVAQITRPVAQAITSQLCKATAIPDDTEIMLYSSDERASIQGSTIDDANRDVRLMGKRRLQVKYQEQYDAESVVNIQAHRALHSPVFQDPEIRVSLAPIYANVELTMEFVYQSTSENDMSSWLADFVMRVSRTRLAFPHQLQYSFTVPDQFLDLVDAIQANRVKLLNNGETSVKYLMEHITPRATIVSTVNGSSRRLAVAETQMDVWGYFDFDIIPDAARLENELWQVSFTYKVAYRKAIGVRAEYPIMVYNSLLPAEYIAFGNTGYDPMRVQQRVSPSEQGLAYFDLIRQSFLIRDTDYIVRIPYFDDKVLRLVPANTGTVMTVLCDVASDKRYVLSLDQLGDFVIDPDIMDFIVQSEWRYMTQSYKSILQLHLYHGDHTLPMEQVTLTQDLKFSSKQDLNLCEEHRVRLSLVTELAVMDRDAIDRLRNYPKAAIKLIGAMNDLIRNHPDVGTVMQMRKIEPYDLLAITRLLRGQMGTGMRPEIVYGSSLNPGSGRNPVTGNGVNGRGTSASTGDRLFDDIPDSLIQQYHHTRRSMQTTQSARIIAMDIVRNRDQLSN